MTDILSAEQISSFITDGFVRIDRAFPAELASQVRNILWKDLPGAAGDPLTWTQPVVRLGMYTQEAFVKAANTPILHAAFDQLVGKENWLPCGSMGSFPVRFPSHTDPGDTGWHVDAGFPGTDPANYFEWRINVGSKGRALLMLFLFSDVSEPDAPTRIRKGSHADVARLLAPYGEDGLSFMELAQKLASLPEREVLLATGNAGTVYLCHPFLVHGAQPHHGTEPRFMAQPPLLPRAGVKSITNCPLAEAIRLALSAH